MLGPDPRGPRYPASSQQPGYAGAGPPVPPNLFSVHTQKLRHGCGCISGSHWSVTGAGWALGVGMYMLDHPLSHMGNHHCHRRSVRRFWRHYRKGQSGRQSSFEGYRPWRGAGRALSRAPRFRGTSSGPYGCISAQRCARASLPSGRRTRARLGARHRGAVRVPGTTSSRLKQRGGVEVPGVM